MHIALAGCLKAPPIAFGVTKDTGGHIAYVIDAALAQGALETVESVTIVTRYFEHVNLDPVHSRPVELLGNKVTIRRIATRDTRYLEKTEVAVDLHAFTDAFLADLARSGRPDIIHAHFADAAAVAVAARDRFGIPFFYTPHALALGGEPSDAAGADAVRVAAERAALASADGVVVSSHDEAERQVGAYGVPDVAPRLHRIAPGIPTGVAGDGEANAMLGAVLDDPAKPIVLAVARPVRKKNLVALAEAYASSEFLRTQANLVIVAGQHNISLATDEERAVLHELEGLAGDPRLRGQVVLPGRHTTPELQALYRHVARGGGIFVNPALHEPFGLTLLEAAAVGLPVVTTRHGGSADIVAEIGHGLTVDPADRSDLVRACLRILGDRRLYRDFAEAAVRNRDAFSWSRYAWRSVDLYGTAIRPARPVKRKAERLLASDIDGTLTGCREAASRFAQWSAHRDLAFVVATGRSLSDARAVIAAWDLPEPDAFITSVGTAIYRRDEAGTLKAWTAYAEALDGGWDRDAVLAVAGRMHLEPQSAANQSRHKLSYFGPARSAALIEEALDTAGLPAKVVFSHGRYIDILAPRAGKAAAVEAYAGSIGLSLADCLAAGDSGNDLDMLERCGVAIVVGNAGSELDGLRPRPGLIRARSPFADGVLEGLSRADIGSAVDAAVAA